MKITSVSVGFLKDLKFTYYSPCTQSKLIEQNRNKNAPFEEWGAAWALLEVLIIFTSKWNFVLS